tara:strand:- start:378 stop:935 length:558 start_codon:yes stop_codon:yes gene_type:complete
MTKSILEQFGSIIKPIEEEGDKTVSSVLVEWVNERIKVAKDVLESNDKNASRTLSQSIAPLPIVEEDGVIQIQVEANDYWDFVNSGVDGTEVKRGSEYSFTNKQPPVQSIRQWMFDKSITTSKYFDKSGALQVKQLVTEQDFQGLAFAIAKGVKKKGQEAVPYMDIAFSEEALKDLENRILELWQ